MTQLPPRDDVKKQVSETLKRVDHLIRTGSIDQAIQEVMNAKEIDSSNAYVLAYEQRLEVLKLKHEKHAAEEVQRKEAEKKAREHDQALRMRQEEDNQRLLQKQNRLREEQKQQTLHSKSEEEQIQKDISSQQESQRTINNEPGSSKVLKSDRNVPERKTDLQQLKAGSQPQTKSNSLIQDQKRDVATTILVIDDDVDMLQAIEQTLVFNDFNVTVVTTTDEALALLQKWMPDLILCDVNLETSTMGGFSFYELIRKFEHLNQVPFIFLSGLNDQILIRTGKEMGVDDYLTKPISEKNLIAAVKGKIKRFALLNRKR